MMKYLEFLNRFINQYDNNTLQNIPKFPLAIILKEGNKLIGNIGIGHYSNDKSKMEIFLFYKFKLLEQRLCIRSGRSIFKICQGKQTGNFVNWNSRSGKYSVVKNTHKKWFSKKAARLHGG